MLIPRAQSEELKLLRALNGRMLFTDSIQQHYTTLKKGFDGEVDFDQMLGQLSSENLILSDLWLEVQNSPFQIDTLLIQPPNTILAFEVKNFEGEYYIENDNWFTLSHQEVKNPLLQVSRNESLFRRYLQKVNSTFQLKYLTVFINPEFTLYQAPLNKGIILPTQIKKFLRGLNKNSGKLNQHHTTLAKRLLADRCSPPTFSKLPDYHFDQLKKGIVCNHCKTIDMYVNGNRVVCNQCHESEPLDKAILRSVEEFILLFPSEKITTVAIHDWCSIIDSKKTIRRVLSRNYTTIGNKRHTYYVKR